jgi:hypothetical protein
MLSLRGAALRQRLRAGPQRGAGGSRATLAERRARASESDAGLRL